MNDWDDFRYILALKRSGTLRGAAQALRVNHTTVSRKLNYLNKKYGFELFERSVNGYSISQKAASLCLAAEEIESLILGSQRRIKLSQQEMNGDITLSIPDAIGQYLLLNELTTFARNHPHINLMVKSSYQFANLDRSEADIVIRGCNNPPDHLTGYRLFPYYTCIYGNSNMLASVPRSQWKWIVPPSSSNSIPQWIIDSPYADIPIGITIDDVTTRHLAVVNGLGIARGACYMADPESKLTRLPGASPSAQLELWVLTHPDLKDVPRIHALMVYLRDAIRAKQPLITGNSEIYQ